MEGIRDDPCPHPQQAWRVHANVRHPAYVFSSPASCNYAEDTNLDTTEMTPSQYPHTSVSSTMTKNENWFAALQGDIATYGLFAPFGMSSNQ